MIVASSLFTELCNEFAKPIVPEFDGSAGLAAIVLLVSIAAVVYDKSKK